MLASPAQAQAGSVSGVNQSTQVRKVQFLSLGVLIFLLLCTSLLRPYLVNPLSTTYFDSVHSVLSRTVERFPVLIVDVDEATIQKFGQWPWPRWQLAELINKTAKLQPLAIGLDILMPEPDRHSPSAMAEHPGVGETLAAQLKHLPDSDQILAKTIAQHQVVIGRAGTHFSTASGNTLASPATQLQGALDKGTIPAFPHVLGNIKQLETAASASGVVNAIPDSDGVVRSTPLVFSLNGKLNLSLPAELLRTALGENWATIETESGKVSGIRMGDALFGTEPDGSIRPHFAKSQGQRRVSAGDVLNNKLPVDFAQGQLVLIGVTGLGLADVAATPVQAIMDGVEIQAQVIENLIADARLLQPAWLRWVEAVSALLGGLLLIGLFPRLGAFRSPGVWLLLVVIIISVSVFCFSQYRLQLDPVQPALTMTGVFVFLILAFWKTTENERRRLNAELIEERVERAKIAGELLAAHNIQMGILPDPAHIENLPSSLSVHAILQPASEVGGDYFDLFMLDNDRLFFSIADVSGKGVPAALFMALGKTLSKSVALRSASTVAQVTQVINKEISRENAAQLFITAIYGVIEASTGQIYFCNAGHDKPFKLFTHISVVPLVSNSGPPLCVVDDYEYPVNKATLEEGEALLLYTDGVTEAMKSNKEMYGSAKLLEKLYAMKPEQDARSIVDGIYSDIVDFYGDDPVSDDITILCIRRHAV